VKGVLLATRKDGELANMGILGRLGDLATVDEKYDVAVSTACTMLDHIVVQTTAGAQRCLTFLRKYGLGRANFIPLDKMKKGAHDRAVETPEGAPRLFDLIHSANFAVTPALYLGVGNTLVAPDLETATRWAYEYDKRWRVVTLDGQLIETSGTMSGGGKTVRKGGMRLKNASRVTPSISDDDAIQDYKEFEVQAQQAGEDLKNCRHRRRDIAHELQSIKKNVKNLKLKIPKLAMEIEGFDTTRITLTERIPDLRSQCQLSADDQSKLKELNSEVEKRKMEMASCAMHTSKLEAEVTALQKAILEAGGAKLKKQQTICEKVLKDMDSAEKKLNEARIAIKSNEKAASKAKGAQKSVEDELRAVQTSLQSKQQELRGLEEGAAEVKQKFEEVKSLEANKRRSFEEISQEVEELQKSQSKLKGSEIEAMGKVEALVKQLKDLEKKQQHWELEIEKLHAIEEDEDDCDASDNESETGDENNVDDTDASREEENDIEMEDTKVTEGDETKPKPKFTGLPRFPSQALEQYREEDIKKQIAILESEKAVLAKNANMGAIQEYRKKEADYLSR
jgi:structural maintenance of chromosome 4